MMMMMMIIIINSMLFDHMFCVLIDQMVSLKEHETAKNWTNLSLTGLFSGFTKYVCSNQATINCCLTNFDLHVCESCFSSQSQCVHGLRDTHTTKFMTPTLLLFFLLRLQSTNGNQQTPISTATVSMVHSVPELMVSSEVSLMLEIPGRLG